MGGAVAPVGAAPVGAPVGAPRGRKNRPHQARHRQGCFPKTGVEGSARTRGPGRGRARRAAFYSDGEVFEGAYSAEVAGGVDGGLAPVHGDAADGGIHLGPAYRADHGVGGEAFILQFSGVEIHLDMFLRAPDEVYARNAIDLFDGGDDVVFGVTW